MIETQCMKKTQKEGKKENLIKTSGYAMWFTAGGAIREPQNPKIQVFLGVTRHPGVAQPLYSRVHN